MRGKPECHERYRTSLGLPSNWIWTGATHGANGVTIYFARDSRWKQNVPDVADTSRAAVIRYAKECEEANV